MPPRPACRKGKPKRLHDGLLGGDSKDVYIDVAVSRGGNLVALAKANGCVQVMVQPAGGGKTSEADAGVTMELGLFGTPPGWVFPSQRPLPLQAPSPSQRPSPTFFYPSPALHR